MALHSRMSCSAIKNINVYCLFNQNLVARNNINAFD